MLRNYTKINAYSLLETVSRFRVRKYTQFIEDWKYFSKKNNPTQTEWDIQNLDLIWKFFLEPDYQGLG